MAVYLRTALSFLVPSISALSFLVPSSRCSSLDDEHFAAHGFLYQTKFLVLYQTLAGPGQRVRSREFAHILKITEGMR